MWVIIDKLVFGTFSVSVRSLGTAITLTAIGIYLHRRGIVNSEGKSNLARISQQVTIPLLLFTRLIYCDQDWSDQPCPSVTSNLGSTWILLLWPLFVVLCGLAVGDVVARTSSTPKDKVRFLLAACAFGNSTGLPITLLSVVHGQYSSDSALGQVDPTIFLSLYLLFYPVLQWGIGSWLLKPSRTPEDATIEFVSLGGNDEATDSQSTNKESYVNMLELAEHDTIPSHFVEDMASSVEEQENAWPANERMSGLLKNRSAHDTKDDLPTISDHSPKGYTETWQTSMSSGIRELTGHFLQPPVLACIIGVFIAGIPFLRGLFVDIVHRQGKAPLQWFFDGLHVVGTAAIPINMMILGCNISASYTSWNSGDESSISKLFAAKSMVGVVLGKLVILPLIGILAVSFLKHHVLSVPDEIQASFYLVMMIVFLTPTANTILIMVELSGSDFKEGMASAIALQYLVAPVSMSLTMTLAITIATR